MSTADKSDPTAGSAPVPQQITIVVDPAVHSALAKWLTESGTTLHFDQWITPGLSGALLATVVLNAPGRSALGLIMKVCPPGKATGKEAQRHAEALEASPGFAALHLVTQPVPPIRGSRGWSILFQEVAGGSLRAIRPLSTIQGVDLSQMIATVVRSVLVDWNPTPRTEPRIAVPFFRELLGSRIDKGGPMDQLAEQMTYDLDLGSPTPLWVTGRAGNIVPNALAWTSTDSWQETLSNEHLMVVLGRAHGDLHADNILIPQKPRPNPFGYRLIDLSAYTGDAPLVRDPSHLLLSMLMAEVADLSELKREEVSAFLLDPSLERSDYLQVSGLLGLIKAVVDVGDQFASQLGLLDHWQDQSQIALAANALIFAARLSDPSMKQWCFELACEALGRFCTTRRIEAPTDAPTACIAGSREPVTVDAARAFETLATGCEHWSATHITILVVDSARLTPECQAKISSLRWRVVVDLNSSTDIDGGWAAALGMPGDRRLVTMGQEPLFGRSSTVWLAAAGLSDMEPIDPVAELRGWRFRHRRFVAQAIEAVSQVMTHPATVVCLGEPRGAERAVVEACVDAFGERVNVLVVSTTDSGDLAEYGANTVLCSPEELLLAVPEVASTVEAPRVATLPGQSGPVVLPQELIGRYSDWMDLLHFEVGVTGERDVESDAFYKGRPITWFELGLGLDVDRAETTTLIDEVLRPSLRQRNTLRVMLTHAPGAGGTTMARRAAWDLRGEFPTVYVRGSVDETVLVQAVGELAQLCDTSVLVVAELVPDSTLRSVFEALRASSVPAVLLITARRGSSPRKQPSQHDEEAQRRYRSQHVGAMASLAERHDVARRFSELAPERGAELFELAARAGDNNVPFFYALTAFGTEFQGLRSYVEQFMEDLSEVEREIAIFIGMSHYFCGVPVPAELFAEALNIPLSESVRLEREITPTLAALLVEEPKGAWRTSHSLIAEEILRQLLSPPVSAPGREDWKAALPSWSLQLIELTASVFGRRLPDDMKVIMDRLFTTRESRESLDIESPVSATYTELMHNVSSPGRIQILRELVSTFPEEPHYWAHLGRLLSYDAGDFVEALDAMDRAIALSPNDPLLHHMRGMVFRNELRARIRDRGGNAAEQEEKVLGLCQSAGDAFRAVSELDDATEYGYIALAQANISVIEFGYGLSRCTKYAQFLARPSAGSYRDLLAEAEGSLEAAREIRGSDRASFSAERVENQLKGLYDDYSGLLQGWRNLLERADLAKPPIRRRLARAYRNRSGSWRKASIKDVNQAVSLLQENLKDNPRDSRSLLEWLWAARFTDASLDQAADLVSGWASSEGTREALFYDYVISFLQAMSGQGAAVADYQLKLERSRERAAWFGNKRFPYEWLGEGSGLAGLVHHSDLTGWDRRSGSPEPSILLRLPGRVKSISKPTTGTISIVNGLEVFMNPSASGLLRGRDENERVTALIALRYDGPMAFNVHKRQ
ncbi:tetratricopeptide repeat protein [Streptomyces sioyaensis]|uniref:tetratricopeptide repeat protein n=1 Tax=Streptomyces sioyaensis TaxID=67364 RepID=UPI0037A6089B